MFAILSVALLSAIVDAGRNDWPFPPNLKGCSEIIVNSTVNCPSKGYQCNENWGIEYNVDRKRLQVICVDENANLAVEKQIVDRVVCRNKEWRAEGNCDIVTTSVVCAKYCDADACPAYLREAPSKYAELIVRSATVKSKCAKAECKYGFAALHSDGTLIKEFPSSTEVTCSGDGKWTVLGTKEAYKHVMCKRKTKDCGGFMCDQNTDTISIKRAKEIFRAFEKKINKYFEKEMYPGLKDLFFDKIVATRLPDTILFKKDAAITLFLGLGDGKPMTWKTSNKALDVGSNHFVVIGDFEVTLYNKVIRKGTFKHVLKKFGENWLLVFVEVDYKDSA